MRDRKIDGEWLEKHLCTSGEWAELLHADLVGVFWPLADHSHGRLGTRWVRSPTRGVTFRTFLSVSLLALGECYTLTELRRAVFAAREMDRDEFYGLAALLALGTR